MDIKKILTDKTIEEAIVIAVKEQVKQTLEADYSDFINREVKSAAKRLSEKKIEKMTEDGINEILANQIVIDDGWGNREEHGSFEALVKETLHKSIKSNWTINSVVTKKVNEAVKLYVEQPMQDYIEGIANNILKIPKAKK